MSINFTHNLGMVLEALKICENFVKIHKIHMESLFTIITIGTNSNVDNPYLKLQCILLHDLHQIQIIMPDF